MRTGDEFPWELLKAECLRLVCAQLVEASTDGQHSFKPARKEDMVTFLRDVQERGVLKAFEAVEEQPKKITTASGPQAATLVKRKSPPADGGEEDAEGDSDNEDGEGYNTRYKGVKRVRVHGFSVEPAEVKAKRKVGRPRKSIPEGDVSAMGEGRKRGRPRKDASASGEQSKVAKRKAKSLENGVDAAGEVVPPISRPRGRPRKVVAESEGVPKEGSPKKPRSAGAPKSMDSGREVFDGILLVKRSTNGKEKAVADDKDVAEAPKDSVEVPNKDADGCEEDVVVAAVNGDTVDLSSLGGSNKENEHEISATYTPDPEEGHDMDADGEFEPDAEAEA